MALSNKEKVNRWRKKTKSKMIAAMGGCCQICGYNRCNSALAFHHINPDEKDFSFGRIMANPKSWIKIVDELRKCILVCHNCHSEIHDGVTGLPEEYSTFDENYVNFKTLEREITKTPCPNCGQLKNDIRKYCSRSCAASNKGKVDWKNVDLYEMYKDHGSLTAIAQYLDVSDVAVNRRMKRMGISLNDLKRNH